MRRLLVDVEAERSARAPRAIPSIALLPIALLTACAARSAPPPESPIELGARAPCAVVGEAGSRTSSGGMGVQRHGPGPAEVLAALCAARAGCATSTGGGEPAEDHAGSP